MRREGTLNNGNVHTEPVNICRQNCLSQLATLSVGNWINSLHQRCTGEPIKQYQRCFRDVWAVFHHSFTIVSPLCSPIVSLNSLVKYFHWLFTSFFIGFSLVHHCEIPIPSYTFHLSSFLCSLLPSPPHSKRQMESFTDMQKKEGEEHHAQIAMSHACPS